MTIVLRASLLPDRPRRPAWPRLLVFMLLLCAWLLPAAARGAAAPALSFAPSQAHPGSVVLVAGRGFAPGEPIGISLDGRAIAASTAGPDGAFPVSGFVVPVDATPREHPLLARGERSGRVARGSLRVVGLSPSVRVVSGPAVPGASIRVDGEGFLPREPIALALNGVGLAVSGGSTAPGSLLTGPDGAFDASFVAPDSLLAGADNSISATGSGSHLTATAVLIANLPVRSDFLFAGASAGPDDRPSLAILNPGGLPAVVHVSLLPDARGGGQPRQISPAIPPYTRATVDLAGLAGPLRQFGIRVQADRRIAATLIQTVRGVARTSAPVVAPRQDWLLAEGFTGLSFQETISLLNPTAAPVTVSVRLLPEDGATATVLTYTVPGERQISVDVSRAAPHRSLAAEVRATAPVVVSRTLRFGATGSGLTTSPGTPLASSTWLFAAGSTTGRFQTFLTLVNPGTLPAAATASFYDSQGRSLGNRTVRIGAGHRGTMALNRLIVNADFATFVTSSEPIVVERPLYLGDPNGRSVSGTVIPGANGASLAASFADGDSSTGSRERILLLNPTARAARVEATFYSAGATTQEPVRISITLPPLARRSIDVAAALHGRLSGPHGSVLRSLNGVGFVAEQTITTFGPGGAALRTTPALAQ